MSISSQTKREVQTSEIKPAAIEGCYRALFEYSRDGILIAGPESYFIDANRAICGMLGYTADEITGLPVSAIVAAGLPQIKQGLTGLENQSEWQFRRKDGSVFVASVIATLTPEGNLLAVVRDITGQKQAYELLVESEERYRDLVENAIDIIYTQDLKGNYISVNRAVEKMTGYTVEEALSMNLAQAIAPEYLEKATQMLAAKLAGQEVTAYDLELLAKDGRRIAVELNTRVLYENGAPIGIQGIARDVTERKQAEDALRDSNEKFHQLADNITDAFWIRSPDMQKVYYISPAFEQIWGRTVESMYATPNMWAELVFPEDRERVITAFAALTGTMKSLDIEYRIVRPDGGIRWIRVRGFQVRDGSGVLIRHVGVVTDITGRKALEAEMERLEDQLRQAQKMEAIGQLAGGIAHDFNNLLTAINGYSALTLRRMEPENRFRGNIQEIKNAGERAAQLTDQLLAFSRKQVLQPTALNLNTAISGMENMLGRIIRESIEVRTILDAGLGNIKADPGQIEQVIMNLAVNARDAMPAGGTLTIETKNVYLDEDYASQHIHIVRGPYVRMTVSDSGMGMDERTRQRIFEPFFTTKEQGKGTGLGLSTVHGIVTQSGGHIIVYSEPGHGTTFKIYLPRIDEIVHVPKWAGDGEEDHTGNETILLVEDEDIVRDLVRVILSGNGYNVLEADSGKAALSICETHQGPIDMLLTDVIMPGMGGSELKDRVIGLRPETKILFMSGYTDDAITHGGVLDMNVAFIEKPFTPDSLSRKIREVVAS